MGEAALATSGFTLVFALHIIALGAPLDESVIPLITASNLIC